MKKIFLLLCLFSTIGFKLFANPIIFYPDVHVSELYFDELKDWTIELSMSQSFLKNNDFDSISVCNSTERTKVLLETLVENEDYRFCVFTKNNLEIPLEIDNKSDSLTFIFHYNQNSAYYGKEATQILVFGNYATRTIHKLTQGESIICTKNYYNMDSESGLMTSLYSRCSNPTLGLENDLDAATATLRGKIYDENNLPYTSKEKLYFENSKSLFTVNNSGNYEAEVYVTCSLYTMLYSCNNRSNCSQDYDYEYKSKISPFHIYADIGDIIDQDIYMSEPITNNTTETEMTSNFLKIYPNPIKEDLTFNYELDLPFNSIFVDFEIISSSGQLIHKEKITTGSGSIQLPNQTIPGVYFVRYLLNNKEYNSIPIVITK